VLGEIPVQLSVGRFHDASPEASCIGCSYKYVGHS
jgi:hypothetical protein